MLFFLYVSVLMGIIVTSLASVITRSTQARTYVITDGDRVVTYTSFETDPGEVLDQAGLALGTYDSYTTQAEEGTRTITICRAQNITVHYRGETMQATSYGETAGELLQRLNLDVSGEDVVSHGLEEMTYDGMVLRVDRVVTVRETYAAAVPHEIIRCRDASIPEGEEEILTAGVDGELLCTADVTYVNGMEASRQICSETQTIAPVTEIIGVGAAEASAGVGTDAMPVIADGFIFLPTGEVLTYTHTATIRATAYTHTDAGCDFITSTGTTVHWGTVAVDPRYIPYGTRMFIVANDGSFVYGIAVAEDCGGDIKGDRMDLYMPTYAQCIQFGRRVCTIYFLG